MKLKTILTTFAALMLSANVAFAGGNYIVNTSSANLLLRSGAGSNYSIKARMPKGAQVYVNYINGAWANVTYNGITGFASAQYLKQISPPAPAPTPSNKISSFISDYRWREGVAWNGSQRPKLSPYSASGCAAYAADYAKYVYNNNSPRGGSRFTSTSAVRAGDILHLTGGKYGQHWLVVLNRSGNILDTISGNLSNKVTRRNYSINGNYIYSSQAGNQNLADGYHF